MGLFAAFAVLALLNTAVCYALYRLAAFFQQEHWEQSTIGGMPVVDLFFCSFSDIHYHQYDSCYCKYSGQTEKNGGSQSEA